MSLNVVYACDGVVSTVLLCSGMHLGPPLILVVRADKTTIGASIGPVFRLFRLFMLIACQTLGDATTRRLRTIFP